MASSVSGQDEPNLALWLVTRAAKMALSCPLGSTLCVPQEKFPRKPYNKPLLTKLVRSRWLDTGLVLDYITIRKRTWPISSHIDLTLTCYSPMTLPADELGCASCASRETTLKDARGVEPGCVEIMPRKRVTFHERTWLYSEQMETRFFSLSMTFTTGFRWTMNVWKSWGPWPTVSGCWTITRTVPELVPYAISIQLPLKPDKKNKTVQISLLCQ